jgi:hypothetical protein
LSLLGASLVVILRKVVGERVHSGEDVVEVSENVVVGECDELNPHQNTWLRRK